MNINIVEIEHTETIRAFFAIMIPKRMQERIIKIISQLKKNPLYRNIRWTKPKNLHITLRFLGSISRGQLADICNSTSTIKLDINMSFLYFIE